MKSILLFLLIGLLCLGITGCEDDNDDSPSSTTTTVTTNAATGVVQTNVEEVANEAFGAPVAANTVTGRWIGFCDNGGDRFALSLKLAQAGETVTGSYAWWPDDTWSTILSGTLSGNTFLLAVKRNDILFSLDGQVDFTASTISGTWEDQAENSGTFSMREW